MHFEPILTVLEPFIGRVPEKAKKIKMDPNFFHYKNTIPAQFGISVFRSQKKNFEIFFSKFRIRV